MPVGAGTVLKGRYELLRPLAQEQAFSDWLAFDRQVNGPALLRTIGHGEGAEPAYADRVRRQVERLNHIRAPHVVHVYELWTEEAATCVAMEAVAGRTVADLLREHGPLSPLQALAILRGAAQALEPLAKAHLPHGDIAADALRVVLDEAGCASAVSLLQFANPLRLPHYTAPEQVDGSAPQISADIYALGVVCWETLAAHAPSGTETTPKVLRQQRDGSIPSIRTCLPDVPDQQVRLLDQVLRGCLAKDRQDRFSSPSALISATEEIAQRLEKGTPQISRGLKERTTLLHPGCQARLTTGSGRVLPLAADKVRVGRNSGDIVNDVDLGPEEGSSTVHRRHLRLERRGDQWYALLEPGAKNPTSVAGRVLSPGRPVPVRDGDEIRVSGVSMVFHVGRQD